MLFLKNATFALVLVLTFSTSVSLHAATNVVKIRAIGARFVFDPTNITINAGSSITWTNADSLNKHDTRHHPPTGPVLWQSVLLSNSLPNNTFAFTFTNAGFYPYYCFFHNVTAPILHPEQTGTVSVVAANVPPTVSITDPTNDAPFFAPASFTIQAKASDPGGNVAQVEFFRGTTSLGVSASSPYSNNVTALGVGNYALTAVATDNQGAKATSGVVNVTITSISLGSAQLSRDGLFQFRISGGIAGQSCIVDACDTLPNWTPIATNTFPNTPCPICPSIDFTDFPASPDRRFYRCRVVP